MHMIVNLMMMITVFANMIMNMILQKKYYVKNNLKHF